MMWLAINGVGTVHHTPQIRMWGGDGMIEPVYDESEKIIKIGDSEFYGRLNLDDELVIVDDRKFNYAADFRREFKKQLKNAKDAAYKRGFEAGKRQKKSVTLKGFLENVNSNYVIKILVKDEYDHYELEGIFSLTSELIHDFDWHIVESWKVLVNIKIDGFDVLEIRLLKEVKDDDT